MDVVFAVLGVLDVFAAYLLFNPFSNAAVLYVMVYMLAKGGFFFLTTVTSKAVDPFFVMLCLVDIVTGVALGSIALDYASMPSVANLISLFKLIAAAKGLYGSAVSVFG